MHRIKSVRLKNFKFFYELNEIPVERNHLLLYGENGSGKSSVYWGLYTFFQSVFKPKAEVNKYFVPISRNDQSLRNRYAADTADSFIEIEFEDESQDLRTKKISDSVVNTKTDDFVELITLTSDLIDYKSIFNLYNFTNRDRVRLFDYIERHLMPYINLRTQLVKIDGTKGTTNLQSWWEYLKPGMNPYPKINGPGYWEFQGLIESFNTDFKFYLNSIIETANDYLRDSFKEKILISIDYQDCTYNDFNTHNRGRNQMTVAPEVFLSAKILNPNLTDETGKIQRIHTFLNEARLSSIALALRMAILKEKFIAGIPKVLVLDDLLISLDMGNREAVLKIIFEEYASDYQILFLTHDKIFFHSIFSHIRTHHSNAARKSGETDKEKLDSEYQKHWKVLELYESQLPNQKLIPTITEHKSSLQKALFYFNNREHIDYHACGNNLRVALEEFFRDFLPSEYKKGPNGDPIPVTSLTLNPLLIKCIDYFNALSFDTKILDKLNRYRERSLNATSHYNPTSNYFKKELQETFEIINQLKKYKNDPMIKSDDLLQFQVNSISGKQFTYTIQCLDHIRLYLEPDSGKASFYNPIDVRAYAIRGVTNQDTSKLVNINTGNRTLNEFYEETAAGLEKQLGEDCIREADIYSVFKDINGISLNDLKKY